MTQSSRTAAVAGPPQGWNSFDSYGLFLDEGTALAGLDWFAEHLAPHGYEFFVIDGGWYNEYDLVPGTLTPTSPRSVDQHLDGNGRYLPSKTYFPGGIAPLAERAHELGLKLGLHLMRGVPRRAVDARLPVAGSTQTIDAIADVHDTCRWSADNYGVDMTRQGAQEYYDSWIALIASWGVDLIKADDITAHPAEIEAVATAIERCGRPIRLSLSPGGDTDMRHLAAYRRADMLRVTPDIWDRRSDLDRAFHGWYAWQHLDGGPWLDLDMLCLGRLRVRTPNIGDPANDPFMAAWAGLGRERDTRLTPAQQRTMVTMRALASSPLFFGGDPLQCDEDTLALITDGDMLRCNQEGRTGRLRYADDSVEVWVSPHRTNDRTGWFGVFNRTDKLARAVVPAAVLNPDDQPMSLRSVWDGAQLPPLGYQLDVELEPDDVMFIRYDVPSSSTESRRS